MLGDGRRRRARMTTLNGTGDNFDYNNNNSKPNLSGSRYFDA
jgi:hypothetical protein